MKNLFQEGGCSVPVAVNTDIQGAKVPEAAMK